MTKKGYEGVCVLCKRINNIRYLRKKVHDYEIRDFILSNFSINYKTGQVKSKCSTYRKRREIQQVHKALFSINIEFIDSSTLLRDKS